MQRRIIITKVRPLCSQKANLCVHVFALLFALPLAKNATSTWVYLHGSSIDRDRIYMTSICIVYDLSVAKRKRGDQWKMNRYLMSKED